MIARKSALIIATYLLDGLLGYVGLFFITRHMSPTSYGIMAFAYSFVALFSIFGSMGFDQAHVKKVSEGKDLGTCIGTFLTVNLGLTGLMGIVTITAIFFWESVMGRGFESSTHELAVYLMLLYFLIRIPLNTFSVTFNARKEIAKIQLPAFLEVLVKVIATIYVALAGYEAMEGAIALVLTYIAGDIAFILLTLYFSRGYPIKKPSRTYFMDYLHFAIPLIVVGASAVLMTNIDRVLIQLFWSAEDVGYYFAAYRISAFICLFTTSIGMLLFPTYSSLHAKKDLEGIRLLTRQSERYISMMVFPATFGLVALAGPITTVLLSKWDPALPILQILTFFVLLEALERPYQTQFVGMGYPKLARNRILLMVVLNVILNLLLIPRDLQMFGVRLAGWGARGAALATVISYGAGLVYSRYFAWKLTGVKGSPRVVLHLVAALVMLVVLYAISNYFVIGRWYLLLGAVVVGAGIYVGVLYVLREFTKEDWRLFLDTLNVKKMFTYINEEIKGK